MKRSFTLTEVVIVVVIFLIISSLAIVGYVNLVDKTKQRACEANLKMLNLAIQAYAAENDRLPAILGELEQKQCERAYAQVLKEDGWYTRFSFWFLKVSQTPEAYAQFLTPQNLQEHGVADTAFTCPADTNGLPSYAINGHIAAQDVHKLPGNVVLVADSDLSVFYRPSDLSPRHKALGSGKHGNLITVDKSVISLGDGENFAAKGADDGANLPPEGPPPPPPSCLEACYNAYNTCMSVCAGAGSCEAQCHADKTVCVTVCDDDDD